MTSVLFLVLGVILGLLLASFVVVVEVAMVKKYGGPVAAVQSGRFMSQAEIILPVSHEDKLAEEARQRAKLDGRDWVGLDEMYDT